MWRQVIDPYDNLLISSLVALVPILVIFWALIIRKLKGYKASLLAVAAAAGNLVGKEADLFRFTVKHSFFMLLFICFIVLGQAYLDG